MIFGYPSGLGPREREGARHPWMAQGEGWCREEWELKNFRVLPLNFLLIYLV